MLSLGCADACHRRRAGRLGVPGGNLRHVHYPGGLFKLQEFSDFTRLPRGRWAEARKEVIKENKHARVRIAIFRVSKRQEAHG